MTDITDSEDMFGGERKLPSHVDFIDFGASKGGVIEFAVKRLGGRCGLGIDIDPAKVRLMRERGHECIQGDITKQQLPPRSVKFVTLSHVLEHLPDLEAVKKALRVAATTATDFLFIQGPFFDADEYLRELGLKFFWSSWRGHPCHLTSHDLRGLLRSLGLDSHEVLARLRVRDSMDPAIHPLESPRDQHEYNPDIHPPKEYIEFDRVIYREMVCYVQLRPLDNWAQLLEARRGATRLPAERP